MGSKNAFFSNLTLAGCQAPVLEPSGLFFLFGMPTSGSVAPYPGGVSGTKGCILLHLFISSEIQKPIAPHLMGVSPTQMARIARINYSVLGFGRTPT
jgi:hypothetical protein